MSKLLIERERYERLSPTSLSEAQYEQLIMQDSGLLFPSFVTVPFKATVSDGRIRKQGDLAIIDRQYRSWWVVEVELATHSFGNHVLPQVEALSRGQYGARHAEVLASASQDLETEGLRRMMLGDQPRVLVVVNRSKPDWRRELSPYGALVAVVEVYRSSRNVHALRVNGDEIPDFGNFLSACQTDPRVRRLVRVDSPGALPLEEGASAPIRYGSDLAEWCVLSTADTVWLCPSGSNPLPVGSRHILIEHEDGSLEFRAD